MAVVQACNPEDLDVSGVCTAPYWVELPASVFPPLTEAQALELWVVVAGLLAAAFGFRLLRRFIWR